MRVRLIFCKGWAWKISTIKIYLSKYTWKHIGSWELSMQLFDWRVLQVSWTVRMPMRLQLRKPREKWQKPRVRERWRRMVTSPRGILPVWTWILCEIGSQESEPQKYDITNFIIFKDSIIEVKIKSRNKEDKHIWIFISSKIIYLGNR